MRKIIDLLRTKRTLSFEFFPPKTDEGRAKLYEAAEKFAALGADFFSVTYGAGGSTSKATLEILTELYRRTHLPVMHHFTCVGHGRKAIAEAMAAMRAADVCNVLAMRGDLPVDQSLYAPLGDEPRFGYELVELLREEDDFFCVGVPGFPEGHVHTPTRQLDSQYLKIKQDAGAEFVITQLFFNNAEFDDYIVRTAHAGVTMPIVPGILPITDFDKLVKFCDICGAALTPAIVKTFAPLAGNAQATLEMGIDVVTRQCQELLDRGCRGLHFFCLNKYEPVATIVGRLKVQPFASSPR